MKKDIYNIIVAAGKGSRFGSDTPKQFCRINGMPVLAITLNRIGEIFGNNELSDEYNTTNIVVLNDAYRGLWAEICAQFSIAPHMIVSGGKSRWESVKNAIDTIIDDLAESLESTIITVHDGARPVIDYDLFAGVIDGITDGDGCIPVIPVVDSLRAIDLTTGSSIPLNRDLIRAVQTPQAFRGELLADAYKLPFDASFTDDASVMAKAGYTDIRLSSGNPNNIKITLSSDLEIASIYLRNE